MSTHTQDRDEFSLSSLEVARSLTGPRAATMRRQSCRRAFGTSFFRASTWSDSSRRSSSISAVVQAAERALRRRYRRSRVFSVDLSLAMLREADRRRRPWRRFAGVCADAIRLPLADTSTDLVFSNLMLQWCADPEAVFRECSACCDRAGS